MVQLGQHRAVSRQPDVRAKRERLPAKPRQRRKTTAQPGRRNRPRDDADSGRRSGQCTRERVFFASGPAGRIEGGGEVMKLDLLTSLYVFMLAAFIGFEVIRPVSPLLHTPLMSLTNALEAIPAVGAIILGGEHQSTFPPGRGTNASVARPRNAVAASRMHD